LDPYQSRVPARFQFGSDKAVFRIYIFVASRRKPCFVSCLLDLQLKRLPMFLPLLSQLFGCLQSSFDRITTDRIQYKLRDGIIDPKTAERYAPVFTMVDLGTLTVVTRHV
jgi:hypothetical protein